MSFTKTLATRTRSAALTARPRSKGTAAFFATHAFAHQRGDSAGTW